MDEGRHWQKKHEFRSSALLKGLQNVPCNEKQAVCLLLLGKKETLQYEGVECIREQVLYINSILNGYKSNFSKLWELKFDICFHMDENRRFCTEMEPEALERRLRLTQSPSCNHQAQEGEWWHHVCKCNKENWRGKNGKELFRVFWACSGIE